MASDSAGTTITFGTSGFTANVISISGPNSSRGNIDSTHLGTTNARTHIPTELYEGGELSMVVEYNGSQNPPLDGAAETVTIDPGGEGNSVSFSGFCNSWEPDIPESGNKMTATMGVKVAGTISPIT